ncbi:MAG: hypothetical protein KDA80_08760 [Planctomycetaceae bacterium]|nr:hypothetical protein [Planctomycetaceae bacterium]
MSLRNPAIFGRATPRFPFERISRSASPGTGLSKAHKHEQEMLLEAAFSKLTAAAQTS